MGVRIKQPGAAEDRPKIVSTSIVGAVSLGLGLWLAHAAMGHPAPEAALAEDADASAFAPDEGAGDVTVADEPAAEDEALVEDEDEVDAEPVVEAEAEPVVVAAQAEPAPEAEPDTEIALAEAPRFVAPPTPPPTTRTPSTTPPPRGTGVAARVRRGRVAYLRCDGAPQTSGPFPCPRDAALEASVWGAIDQVTTCASPVPPGNVDLVLEWDRESGATAPTIATRDTFPDEALRSDAAAVVACLTPSLSALTTAIPGDRIRVGFRFELQ